ncbi:GNAT family N-acetyltransferase [Opitutus terrae]|uniref:GCN5-related N-acetyltransferase n=1 Tax=Opitutus terrae (strain DSM 11246 / JCM 15787 / PB90-1) TaxID=452637 RepID=B1ZNJ6_OPITP|nr:GNAT family N-acetyltransferase [Opitutus terrae]ACB74430.1 GCN5-related N-acetyltransferase [Opitutus terrae PB90-1]
MKIEALSAETATGLLPDLAVVLMDAVRNGASVGFLEPLGMEEASAYWRRVIAEIPAGLRVLFGAFDGDGRLVGTAQLALDGRANGRHRAEVQKVLVRSSARRHGVGAQLMSRIEAEAVHRGRRLLFLDTSTGPGGATDFYAALGYTFVGGIPE